MKALTVSAPHDLLKPRMRPARVRGFTLFELMIVLSIAAILSALAIPGMRSFLQTQEQISAVTNLVTELNYARNEAIKEDVPVTGANCTGTGVCLCASANGTTCDPAGNWNNGWIVFSSNPSSNQVLEATGALQAGLTLSTNPAAPAVTFQPNGMTNLGALTEFVLCDSRGAAYAREVEVDVTGSIQASSKPGYDVTGTTPLACP